MKERWLRIPAIAERLNISISSAYALVAEGHFIAAKFGGCLRVSEASLQDYIRRRVALFALETGIPD